MSWTCTVCNTEVTDNTDKCPKCGTIDPTQFRLLNNQGGVDKSGCCLKCGSPLPFNKTITTCPYCGEIIPERASPIKPEEPLLPLEPPDRPDRPDRPEPTNYEPPTYSGGGGGGFHWGGAQAIIGLVIGFMLVAILFPIAMTQVITASTSTVANVNNSWNSAVAVIFAVLLPIMIIIGVAVKYLGNSD